MTLAISFANIYMVFLSRVVVPDVTARKECFKPFFSSSFKSFRGLPRFVLKGIFTWYFSTNFSMTSAFLCGLFGKWLSAWDRLRWSVCLLLNELSGLEEHWPASSSSSAVLFSLFVVCGIVYWTYTTRISLDFPLIWHSITFYEGHRFSSFVHFLYFCITYIFLH